MTTVTSFDELDERIQDHIDRATARGARALIASIASFVVVLGGIIWWASGVNADVEDNSEARRAFALAVERLARIEATIEGIDRRSERTERRMDALWGQGPRP